MHTPAGGLPRESGTHQDGMLKYRETYEIMDPTAVGIPKGSLVLGKHRGRKIRRRGPFTDILKVSTPASDSG